MLRRLSKGNLCTLCVIIIVIGFLVVAFLGPREPAERPWLNPPAGLQDLLYANDTTLYGANSIILGLGVSTAVVQFPTHGQDLLLYGNYNSPDGSIDFFIIDDEGYSRLLLTGGVLEEDIFVSFNSNGEYWEYTLDSVLNDDSVDNWYVVYSAYTLGLLEFRALSALTCQDRTAPTIQFEIDDEVNETVRIDVNIVEPRGDIAVVRCMVDNRILEEWSPMNSSCSPAFLWDTRAYENGEHWVGVYVEDRVGNNRSMWLSTIVNNTYQALVLPKELNILITVFAIIFSALGVLVVFFTTYRRKGYVTIGIIFMVIGIVGMVNANFTPGPTFDFGLNVVSVVGVLLSAYGVYSGRKEAMRTKTKFQRLTEGHKRIEEKIVREAKKGRRHTTDKVRELREKRDETKTKGDE